MNSDLVKVALHFNAIYIPSPAKDGNKKLSENMLDLLVQLAKFGYTLDEVALRVLNTLSDEDMRRIVGAFDDVFGKKLNWAPLVKDWLKPTDTDWDTNVEVAFFNNICNILGVTPKNCVTLPCGCRIPNGTFDLERYNGCPLCGRPFVTSCTTIEAPRTRLKVLTLATDSTLKTYMGKLLASPIPLDATQIADLKTLVVNYKLPADFPELIAIKETATMVASILMEWGDLASVKKILRTPADVLRLLWYDKTHKLRIIRPAILVNETYKNSLHHSFGNMVAHLDAEEEAMELRLKYPRSTCRNYAMVLNGMDMPVAKACETMHPHRSMWVRVIRALRLPEYARKSEFGYLRRLLDCFYRQDYTVAQGMVDKALRLNDYPKAMELLQKDPGMFARQLFSLMLKYPQAIDCFRAVTAKLPMRLVLSLIDSADIYFMRKGKRPVTIITHKTVMVNPNPALARLSDEERGELVGQVSYLLAECLRHTYSLKHLDWKTMYIAPQLFKIPLPLGQRAQTVTGALSVPQGTRFDVEGDNIRVFLHWGRGMKAAPIDLDISARALYPDHAEECAYYSLTVTGLQHSGDMRAIPDDVGTAEYINVDVAKLRKAGARYVIFTMNAYSYGAIPPNTMAGWMNSEKPMAVDADTGVAFDPGDVEYMIKIDDSNISKGMVFAVLDVERSQMIWLEMPFSGQSIQDMSSASVMAILDRLSKKLSIGAALNLLANANGVKIVGQADITDETHVFSREWAYNLVDVAELLA